MGRPAQPACVCSVCTCVACACCMCVEVCVRVSMSAAGYVAAALLVDMRDAAGVSAGSGAAAAAAAAGNLVTSGC